MTEPMAGAQAYREALISGSREGAERVESHLAEEVVLISSLGRIAGKGAVLESFANSRFASVFAGGDWTQPVEKDGVVTLTVTAPPRAPIGGFAFSFRADERGQLLRIEQELIPAPPVQPTDLELTDDIRMAINGALANGTPVVAAYVDEDGQPHLSFRGSTQVYSDHELAVWNRDPQGGMARALAANPRLAFIYRDPKTRAMYQFHGHGRVDNSEEVRTTVYNNSPEIERNLDFRQRGVAVIVDLERVEGTGPGGRVVMERGLGGS